MRSIRFIRGLVVAGLVVVTAACGGDGLPGGPSAASNCRTSGSSDRFSKATCASAEFPWLEYAELPWLERN